jgi:small subunit ribosomal protein S20
MAHSLSAKKRIRQSERKRLRNRVLRSRIRTYKKKILLYLGEGDIDKARDILSIFYKAVDKAGKVGAIHKNTASRYKARLAKKISKIARAREK